MNLENPKNCMNCKHKIVENEEELYKQIFIAKLQNTNPYIKLKCGIQKRTGHLFDKLPLSSLLHYCRYYNKNYDL